MIPLVHTFKRLLRVATAINSNPFKPAGVPIYTFTIRRIYSNVIYEFRRRFQ